jgi:hypothetical protein
MGIRVGGVVIDANDLYLLSEFWSRLLDREMTRRPGPREPLAGLARPRRQRVLHLRLLTIPHPTGVILLLVSTPGARSRLGD